VFWFKKKVIEEPKKSPTYEVKYIKKQFEVGCANVELTFSDLRKFITIVYGNCLPQYIDKRIPKVEEVRINTGKNAAQEYLHNIYYLNQFSAVHVDDKNNPLESITGNIIHAKIIELRPYSVDFDEAYLEEIKE